MENNIKEKVIVALDYPDLKPAGLLLEKLDGEAYFYKIGSEFFTSCGAKSIELVKNYGGKIFLDLKFHDIPNTVYNAVKSAGKLGADIINVHASGGIDMMKAAKKGCKEAEDAAGKHIDIIAVTVLTNLSGGDVSDIFYNLGEENNIFPICEPASEAAGKRRDKGISRGSSNNAASLLALHLAKLAWAAEMDGVVCSALESFKIKKIFGKNFKAVTPGIRLKSKNIKDDQKRITTPSEAFNSGADYIVVGREITGAENPAAALRDIYSDIENNRG